MAKGEKQNKISAYLLREELAQPEEALRDPKELSSIPFPIGDTSGVFYWKKPKEDDDPPWRDFLENLPAEIAEQLKCRSASAVLFVSAASRWFAISFGFGHTLLDMAAIEPGCQPWILRASAPSKAIVLIERAVIAECRL